jgi:tetratricopeptide (TPR) repeat protein
VGARRLLERALKIDEMALGPEHPDTAIDLSKLARLLNETRHWDEAESYFRRAIAIAEKADGPGHPDTHRYQSYYARLLLDTGRGAEALALGKAALATHEASFGMDHPWTKASARVTADVLDVLGRTEEAAALRARGGLAVNGPYHALTLAPGPQLWDLEPDTGPTGETCRNHADRPPQATCPGGA